MPRVLLRNDEDLEMIFSAKSAISSDNSGNLNVENTSLIDDDQIKHKKIFFRNLTFYVPALLILLMGGFLGYFGLKYNNKFLPSTFFEGQNISGKNTSDARKIIEDRVKSIKITLKNDSENYTASLPELGISLNIDKAIESLNEAGRGSNFFKSLFGLFSKKEVSLEYKIDEQALSRFLETKYGDRTTARNAELYLDEQDFSFKIKDGSSGLGVNKTKLLNDLEIGMDNLSSFETSISIQKTDPEIKSSDLEDDLKNVKVFLNTSYGITVNGKNYIPDYEDRSGWLDYKLDFESKNYSFSIVDEKVDSFSNYFIKLGNIAKEDRTIVSVNGQQIVLKNGQVGKSVINAEDVKIAFLEKVKNNIAGMVRIETTDIAFEVKDLAAISGKWVFSDLSTYTVQFYEGTEVVKSSPMSSGTSKYPTVTGVFNVRSKVRSQTMKGGSGTTSDPYYSVPNVEWIAYFYQSYALHGVYWHDDFGLRNRSHGCIGMSNINAQWMYEWIEIGTPVVVVP